MATSVSKQQKPASGIVSTSILTIGGMTYSLGTLWMLAFGCELWNESRLLISGSWLISGAVIAIGASIWCFCWFVEQIIKGESTAVDHGSYKRRDSRSSDNSGSVAAAWITASIVVLCFSLVPLPTPFVVLGVCFLLASGLLYLILRVYTVNNGYRLGAAFGMPIGYLILWFFSALTPIPWWGFLLFWVVFAAGLSGLLAVATGRESQQRISKGNKEQIKDRVESALRPGGVPVRERRTSSLVRPPLNEIQRSRRARLTSAVASQYGRIPQDTFDLLNQNVRRVTGPVAAALPVGISRTIRDFTVYTILDRVVRDWRENDNLQGLQQDDIADLQSFIKLALYLADANRTNPLNEAIYRATMEALMDDWLDNWNGKGRPGPPVRD